MFSNDTKTCKNIISWYVLAHEAKNYSFHLNSNIMSNMYTLTELCQYTHGVSEKFKYFVTFLRQNCITNQCDVANTLHKIYGKILL